MVKFSTLVLRIVNLLGAAITTVLMIFLGVLIYQSYPGLFTEELAAEQVQEWAPKDIDLAVSDGFFDEEVEYGYHLVTNSPSLMGPGAEDPEMRYAGNNLACVNCHLDSGTKAGSASWIGITERFPQFSNRSNTESTLEDRINGCMERSMNGKKLPEGSREMEAIVAYMGWLSEDLPEGRHLEFKGFPSIEVPDFAVDLKAGAALYQVECARCHGENGEGIKNKRPGAGYYLYPPLGGEDSYNEGAGMHRVITAANFIKGNMPFGEASRENPKLTDEEAYHLAGYINSFSRPDKINKEKDFPDLKLKPISTPYGPWADNFPAVQHKYGPFQPIKQYYKEIHGLTKTK